MACRAACSPARRFHALRIARHRALHRSHVRRTAALARGAKAAALCDQWLSVVCDSMVQTALAGVIAPRFGIIPGTEESIQASLRRAERVLGIVDKHLADHRFFAGEAVTAADLFLVPIFLLFSRNCGVESTGRSIT
jgi:glutathione S-transferase